MATQQPGVDDARKYTLDEWMAIRGRCSGTFTFNGVTYRDAHEVEWRLANGVWLRPGGRS